MGLRQWPLSARVSGERKKGEGGEFFGRVWRREREDKEIEK